jgi:metal-responsive CopG/Arc/MetJ family transcriptional regulator
MKRVNINFTDKQHEDLRLISFNDKKSISEHVRKAVEAYLEKKKDGQKK